MGPTRVRLDWTDAVDDVSAVRYSVNVSGRPAEPAWLSEAVVGGLTARDNWGNAATSNAVVITTPAAGNSSPPTAPGNLLGFESGGCEGWLSWDASTDDVEPPSAIRYDAYVNGQFDTSAFGYTSTIVYATQNGTNMFTIVAVDSSGNESPPSTVAIDDMLLC